MPRAVNSFDVFDTLIARRCVEPHGVLDKLEAQSGVPGLAAARLAADRALGASGHPYGLADIWRKAARALGLDAAARDRLADREVELEHEEVIPVAENLALVRDGDVLVSDTYLPAAVVRSLLRRAGLKRQVALVVSNDGKCCGWVWPRLLAAVPVGRHLGDNPHSDGRTPSEAGIPAVIYVGSRRTKVEQFLTDAGWGPLAEVAREARLANPFATTAPRERYLWNLGCQYNFPLLAFASVWLERLARESAASRALFVSRDGWLWRRLYRVLFPGRESAYFYASRLCLARRSEGFLDYVRSVWRPDAVIVDLCGTGSSWAAFFAGLNQRARCAFLGRIDDAAPAPDAPPLSDWLDVACVFRTSELGAPTSKLIEMLNYAPHAVVEDVARLATGVYLPVLAETLEYDAALPEAVGRAFDHCLKRLADRPDAVRAAGDTVESLIRAMVGMICADRGLGRIYPGHFDADLAYERRLRLGAPG